MRKISLIVGLFMVLALLVSFGYAKSMDHNNKITAIQKKNNKSAVGVRGNTINWDTDQPGIMTSIPVTDQVEVPFAETPYLDRLEDLRNLHATNSRNNNAYVGYVNSDLPTTTFYNNQYIAPEAHHSGAHRSSRVQSSLIVNTDMDMEEEIAYTEEVPENIADQNAARDISEPKDKNDKNKDRDTPGNNDKQKDKDNPGNSDQKKDKKK